MDSLRSRMYGFGSRDPLIRNSLAAPVHDQAKFPNDP